MICNDPYSVFAAGRHPSLLGSRVRKGWPEVADFNDNFMKVGLAGNTLAYRDQELLLNRHGVLEQVWMNLDYPPVIDDDGAPAGVTAIVVETSAKVRAALSELGYRVHVAENGDQAVALLQTIGRIDLLFTDMVMSGMTGNKLAEIVGARLPDVNLLFTTGYARNEAIHNGTLGREVALLPKPFRVSALAAKVRAALDG